MLGPGQLWPSSKREMEELDYYEAWRTELGHWLKAESRCFGDKGDVEDITEGSHIAKFYALYFAAPAADSAYQQRTLSRP